MSHYATLLTMLLGIVLVVFVIEYKQSQLEQKQVTTEAEVQPDYSYSPQNN